MLNLWINPALTNGELLIMKGIIISFSLDIYRNVQSMFFCRCWLVWSFSALFELIKVRPNNPSIGNKCAGNCGLFEFFTIRISVRLSDRSKVTQNKINFIKNCPQCGLNSQLPDHQSHALLTVLWRNLLEISEVSFLLFHAPLHMLDFVYF